MKNSLRSTFLLLFCFFFLICCTDKSLRDKDQDNQENSALVLEDEALLDLVQQQTINYFWEAAETNSGMARERFHTDGEYPC
ncbi:MAG: hypothetical protein HKP23_08110, partial [Flavobacteriaceae bacterium]|nr:hypothetical protein [Eudoraea sp.]NNJ39191.1 hypothetical protein [Flavobacteriaceae bacterium]